MRREWWLVGTCCPIAFESKERAEKFLPLGQRIIHVIEAPEGYPEISRKELSKFKQGYLEGN